jgi:hypothetical protein
MGETLGLVREASIVLGAERGRDTDVSDIVTTSTLVPSNGLMTLETTSFPPGLIKDYLSDGLLGDLGATDLRRFIREATDRRGCIGSDIEIKQPVQVLAFAVAVAAAAALSYRGRESLAGQVPWGGVFAVSRDPFVG